MVTAFAFLILMMLAVGTGYALLAWSLNWTTQQPFSQRLGAAYFVGLAFYIAAVRSLSTLLGRADFSLYITLVLSVCLCAISCRKLSCFACELASKRVAIFVVAGALLFAPLVLIYWLPSNESTDNAFSLIGSLHSVRYAWIANYISECKFIPIVGQNIGQSILSFMVGELSERKPFLSLFLWLYASIVFFAVFLYGFVSHYFPKQNLIIGTVLLLMFANSALSLTHVLVIDSGSPFALNGYTDTLFGSFSVLMLLLYYTAYRQRIGQDASLFSVVFLICVANFFTAPQNMLYLLALIPIMVLSCLIGNNSMKEPMIWMGVLLVAALVSIPQGGMLTPKSMLSVIDYPGLMTTADKGGGIAIKLGVPFHYGWLGFWEPGQKINLQELDHYLASSGFNLVQIVWTVEKIMVTSIRVLFLPIAGIAFFYFVFKRKGQFLEPGQEIIGTPSITTIAIVAAYTFFIGFIINFTLSVGGFKWELSRFMIPGITLGMFGYSLLLFHIKNRSVKFGNYIYITLLSLALMGPLINFIATVAFNAKKLNNSVSDGNRFRAFVSDGAEFNKVR